MRESWEDMHCGNEDSERFFKRSGVRERGRIQTTPPARRRQYKRFKWRENTTSFFLRQRSNGLELWTISRTLAKNLKRRVDESSTRCFTVPSVRPLFPPDSPRFSVHHKLSFSFTSHENADQACAQLKRTLLRTTRLRGTDVIAVSLRRTLLAVHLEGESDGIDGQDFAAITAAIGMFDAKLVPLA